MIQGMRDTLIVSKRYQDLCIPVIELRDVQWMKCG